ncbi:MAG: Hsp33 family molecular chaperone HslO [Kiritimatiellae bacterium]|nr:Hsp33 family molecular chaperone HslO [Kiritimatiellia bacterium]
MISQQNNDCRIKVFFPAVKLTMTYVDVSASARELEQCHRAGPSAGMVLGEALAGVALLGSELTQPGETVTMRMKVSGPVQGVLVEANTEGDLRGYPYQKILPECDKREIFDTAELFGEQGSMEVIRSLPGKIISSASCEIQPVSVTETIERYFSRSLQRMAVADVCAVRSGPMLDGARGALVECMPDGDTEAFDRVHQLFDDNTIFANLQDGSDVKTICEVLGVAIAKIGRPEPLRFACHCSQERVEGMLAGLPDADLDELIAKGTPAAIYCHMCGTRYEVPVERIQSLKDKRER